MAASKNVRMYVNTLLQCSPASVGLAQARPKMYPWIRALINTDIQSLDTLKFACRTRGMWKPCNVGQV